MTGAPSTPRASRLRVGLAVGAGVAAALIYGGQFVVTRWSMQRTLTLWDLAALRFAVAGLLMLAVVGRHGLRKAAGVGWGRALVLAAAAGAPYTLIMFAGLSVAPAAHGAVIITGATPVLTAVLARVGLGQRASGTTLVGLAAIIAGLCLVVAPGVRGGTEGPVWVGDLLFVAAALLWAVFTFLARYWQIEPMRATAMVWVIGLAYVPLYGAAAGARALRAPPGELVFQALYQGIGVAITALALYAWSIRVLGATRAALFMPLVPVFGILLAVPVLGEVPEAVQVVGVVAVTLGMALAISRAHA